ncbi:MAG TPA: hypothetical protein VH518_16805 [Tepidisphaeraceae bacterium]
MFPTTRWALVVPLFLGLVNPAPGDTPAPDARPPGHAAPAIDNNAVQVIHMHLEPHEKIPMHDVTPRVVVWLTDAHLKLTYADGKSEEQHWKAGDTVWLTQGRHAGENLEATPIDFVAVVVKAAAR